MFNIIFLKFGFTTVQINDLNKSRKCTSAFSEKDKTINNSLGQIGSTLTLAAFSIVMIFSAYKTKKFPKQK